MRTFAFIVVSLFVLVLLFLLKGRKEPLNFWRRFLPFLPIAGMAMLIEFNDLAALNELRRYVSPYPNRIFQSVVTLPPGSKGGEDLFVQFRTHDDLTLVLDHYEHETSQDGWILCHRVENSSVYYSPKRKKSILIGVIKPASEGFDITHTVIDRVLTNCSK